MIRIKYQIYYTLWAYWHMWLRRWFDDRYNNGYPAFENRPWYHMCCNGDAGGWRTHLCDHLEYKWRKIEWQMDGMEGNP